MKKYFLFLSIFSIYGSTSCIKQWYANFNKSKFEQCYQSLQVSSYSSSEKQVMILLIDKALMELKSNYIPLCGKNLEQDCRIFYILKEFSLLYKDTSFWSLICLIFFALEKIPFALEKILVKIVEKSKSLPMNIINCSDKHLNGGRPHLAEFVTQSYLKGQVRQSYMFIFCLAKIPLISVTLLLISIPFCELLVEFCKKNKKNSIKTMSQFNYLNKMKTQIIKQPN